MHPAALAAARRSPIFCSGSSTLAASGGAPSPAASSPPSVPESRSTTTATAATAPSRADGELQALAAGGLGLLRTLALQPLLAAPLLFLLPVCHGG